MNGSATLSRAKETLGDLGVKATRATHTIEDNTARIPGDAFLAAAIVSIGVSLVLEMTGRKQAANFVGHWAPTFIALGLYNKIARAQRDMEY